MSSWNYRVVRGHDGLRIFDVYYDDVGRAISTNVAPTYVYGETLAELDAHLQLMREALTLPVLDDEEIGVGPPPSAGPV